MTSVELSPKPIWLIETCLDGVRLEEKTPDFKDLFQLFFNNRYLAFSATEKPKPVTLLDIEKWVENGHAESGTFNYVFAGSEEVLIWQLRH